MNERFLLEYLIAVFAKNQCFVVNFVDLIKQSSLVRPPKKVLLVTFLFVKKVVP